MSDREEEELKLTKCTKHNCEAVPMESVRRNGERRYWVTCKHIVEPCYSGLSVSKCQIHELWNLSQGFTTLQAEVKALREALRKIASGTEDLIAPYRAMGPDQMKSVAQVALTTVTGEDN